MVLGRPPLPFDQTVALQSAKRGKERPGIDAKDALADLFKAKADPIAVHGLEGQGLEDEHVQCALDEVSRLTQIRR